MNMLSSIRLFEPRLTETSWSCTSRTSSAVLPTRFVFVLVPGFSQLGLWSLIGPLQVANTISGQEHFSWELVSEDGCPVKCSAGIRVSTACTGGENIGQFTKTLLPDVVAVCAGDHVERHATHKIVKFLRLCARQGVCICGLGTGAWIMALAGILTDKRCTIHWRKMAALAETFPRLQVDDALFIESANMITCAGELASLDLALHLVKRLCGAELANTVCGVVGAERGRDGESFQSIPIDLRFSGASDKFIEIIRVMKRSSEEPLSLQEISKKVQLSLRQIERLFERNLQTTPLQYYRAVRLARARQLIESTGMSLLNVALACGFASSSHFSKCFKEHYGQLPSEARSLADR